MNNSVEYEGYSENKDYVRGELLKSYYLEYNPDKKETLITIYDFSNLRGCKKY